MNARRRTIAGNLAPLTLEPEKLVVPAYLPRRGGRLRLLAWSQDRSHDCNVGTDLASVKSGSSPYSCTRSRNGTVPFAGKSFALAPAS
jgi:hypothetical protein